MTFTFRQLIGSLAAATMAVAVLHAQQAANIEVITTSAPGGTAMLPVQQTGTGMLVGQVIDAGTNRPVSSAIVAIGGALSAPGAAGGAPRVFVAGPGGFDLGGGGSNQVPRVMTDSEGRFAFRNLPKGTFTLTAQKSGYLEGAYGRFRPGGQSQSVDLGDAERKGDVLIRMFRPAAISGMIVDEAGEPVVGAQVRAYRRNLVSGRRMLAMTGGTVQTDDRGMYRLANLAPGEYIVAVPTVHTSAPASLSIGQGMPPDLIATAMTPGSGGFSFSTGGAQVTPDGKFLLQGRSMTAPAADGRLLAFPTLYFPSASVVSEAQPIVLASGDDRTGIDMTLVPVPTFAIEGRLMGPDGPAAMYALHLVPSNTGDMSADPTVATAITDADGAFMFLGVPQGQYVIQTVRVPRGGGARGMNIGGGGGGGAMFVNTVRMEGGPGPAPAAAGPTLWTSTPVSVGGQDVGGLNLTLREGTKIAGRVEFEGAAEKPTPERLQLISISMEQADGRSRVNMPPARVEQTGSFTSSGVLPGKYLLRANAPPNYTLKQIMVNGVDAADTPIDIESRDIAGVIVTFTDRISELSGTVRNTQGAIDANAAVIVFPSDDNQWLNYGINPRRMRLVRTTTAGVFRFAALPPGDYYAIAISEEHAGDWQDPAFLRELTRDASRVTVGIGSQQTQSLTTRAVQRSARDEDQFAEPDRLRSSSFGESAVALAGAEDPAPYAEDEAHGPFVPDEPQARDTRIVPQVRDATAEVPSGTGSISGVVMQDDPSARPMRRVRVSVRSADQRVERIAVTDNEGRFRVDHLAAGRYSVTATKPAFVTVYYGSKRAGRGPGTPVALTAGQKMDGLTMRMPRGGVISGRVVDDFGVPVQNAQARLFQYQNTSTGRTLTFAPGAQTTGLTDDRGAFRLYGLAAGEYVLSISPAMVGGGDVRQMSNEDIRFAMADVKQSAPAAAPNPTGPARGAGASGVAPGNPAPPGPFGGKPVGLAAVYYPGTLVPEEAATIRVASGQEVTNIDVPLRLLPTARVSGTISMPNGGPAAGVQVMVLPVAGDVHVAAGPMLMMSSGFIRSGVDGKFESGALPPGRYTLAARTGQDGPVMQMGGDMVFTRAVAVAGVAAAPGPQPTPAGNPLWAQQNVDVNGQDLTDIALTLQDGMTVSGRLTFDGKSLQVPDLAQVRLNMMPATQGGISIGVPAAKIEPTGEFTFSGVTPGRYRLMANVPTTGFNASQTWQLKSAIVGGRDTLDTNIEIAPGRSVDGVAVTFTDRSTELTGKLQDGSGNPVSDLMILVFSTDRATWYPQSRRMRQPTQPGSDGMFRFTGLPPGDYYLAAVTDLEQSDWGDPSFMEQVAAASIKISLGEGEKKVQDIRIGG